MTLAVIRSTCYNVLKKLEYVRTDELSKLIVLFYCEIIINPFQEDIYA
jgi:hypothetical protein